MFTSGAGVARVPALACVRSADALAATRVRLDAASESLHTLALSTQLSFNADVRHQQWLPGPAEATPRANADTIAAASSSSARTGAATAETAPSSSTAPDTPPPASTDSDAPMRVVRHALPAALCARVRVLEIDSAQCVHDGELRELAERFPALEELRLVEAQHVTPAGWAHVLGATADAPMWPSLQRITVDGARVDDSVLVALASGARSSLRELSLIECPRVTGGGVRAPAAAAAGAQLGALQTLVLRDCHALTDAGLSALVGACPALRSIEVSCCALVTSAGLKAMARAAPRALEHLGLGFFARLSTDELRGVLQTCGANLVSLELGALDRIDGGVFYGINLMCPRLERIKLGGLTKLKEGGFRALAMCDKLARITISGCAVRESNLVALAQSLRALRKLKVAECEDLTVSDALLRALAAGCPALERLQLAFDRGSVSDAGVAALAAGCTKLAVLYLSGPCDATDASLAALAQYCGAQLVRVGLAPRASVRHSATTAAGWAALVQRAPLLEDVSLLGLPSITDELVDALARAEHLAALHCVGCDTLTCAQVERLARDCARLGVLDVLNCSPVTDAEVVRVVLGNERLSSATLAAGAGDVDEEDAWEDFESDSSASGDDDGGD